MNEFDFYAACEIYPGTGRISRLWVEKVKHGENPVYNEFDECVYPFNMNGRIIAGPFATEEEAKDAWPYDDD